MNYYSFRLCAQQGWAEAPNLRLGQVYFYLLEEIRPDLANEIRGSLIDMFYSDVIPKEAEEFVMSRWDDSSEFPPED